MSSITTRSTVVDVTLSLDTSAYATGDVLADTQVVTNALRRSGAAGVLQSLHVLDEDGQGVAMDILFLRANVSLGTENSAPNISDTNAREILGRVNIATTDYINLGGSQIATIPGIGLVLDSAGGASDLYVAAIVRGTATFTASGIKLRLGILLD